MTPAGTTAAFQPSPCSPSGPGHPVSRSTNHTAGLKSDGTLVATGDNSSGQCDVARLINHYRGGLPMKCPVCDTALTSPVCPVCGYDPSRDYERAPTFAPVADAPSVAALRKQRVPKDALRCEKCGSAAFTIRIPDGTRRCQSCGWSPDPSPHIECTCGGRYFLVRAEDHALICPLCGKLTYLAPQPVPQEKAPVSSLLDRYGKKSAPAAPVRTAAQSPKAEAISPPVITAISTGMYHTVALYSDGRVGAVGDNTKSQCRVQGWTDITAIAAGANHTVGLKADGTVIATGSDSNGQCCVGKWTGVTAIAAGSSYTLGLKADGSLLVAGSIFQDSSELKKMTGLAAVAAGPTYIVGLKTNGRAVTTHPDKSVRLWLESWSDISAIAAGAGHVLGLRTDGVPLAVGDNDYGQRFVNWSNIKAIAAGHSHSVGLRKNGTVTAAGYDQYGQCKVQNWTGITAVAAGPHHTVGLKADGTPVAVGDNRQGQCNVHELLRK